MNEFAGSTNSERLVKRSRLVVMLLFVVVPTMLGCGSEPKPPVPARSTRSDSTEPLDIYVGSTLMRIPWNMLSGSPDQGRAFVGPGPYKTDGVYLGVGWPDMEGQKQGRPGGLNSLFIHIHGYDEPVPPPAEQRKKFVMEYLNLLDGPFVNKASGMREWRAKNGGPPLFFAREDSDFRASDGLEPLVNCDYAGTKEIHSCTGGGAISSTLRYSYRFYPLYFAEWPAMDIAVRKLIESMVVKGE